MVNNLNLFYSEVVAKRVSFGPDDASLSVLPFFHTSGFNNVLESLYIGIRMVLIPRYTFRNFLTSIQHFKVLII